MKKILFLILFFCYVLNAEEIIIYSEDFETKKVFSEFSTNVINQVWQNKIKIDSTPIGNRKFLGQFGNQKINFILNSIPKSDSINITFDFYMINTWDGNYDNNSKCPTDGPDIFSFKINNNSIVYSTFTIASSYLQSYPDNYDPNNYKIGHPGCTGAIEVNTMGFKCKTGGGGDVVYHINKTIIYSNNQINLSFEGILNDGSPTLINESWGIDNLIITSIKKDTIINIIPPKKDTLIVYIPDETVNVGTTNYKIKLYIQNYSNLRFSNINYTCQIAYDATLFWTKDNINNYIIKDTIINHKRILNIEGKNISINNSKTLLTRLSRK